MLRNRKEKSVSLDVFAEERAYSTMVLRIRHVLFVNPHILRSHRDNIEIIIKKTWLAESILTELKKFSRTEILRLLTMQHEGNSEKNQQNLGVWLTKKNNFAFINFLKTMYDESRLSEKDILTLLKERTKELNGIGHALAASAAGTWRAHEPLQHYWNFMQMDSVENTFSTFIMRNQNGNSVCSWLAQSRTIVTTKFLQWLHDLLLENRLPAITIFTLLKEKFKDNNTLGIYLAKQTYYIAGNQIYLSLLESLERFSIPKSELVTLLTEKNQLGESIQSLITVPSIKKQLDDFMQKPALLMVPKRWCAFLKNNPGEKITSEESAGYRESLSRPQ